MYVNKFFKRGLCLIAIMSVISYNQIICKEVGTVFWYKDNN